MTLHLPLLSSLTVILTRDLQLLGADCLKQMNIPVGFSENDLYFLAMNQSVRLVNCLLLNGDSLKNLIKGEYPVKLPRAPRPHGPLGA